MLDKAALRRQMRRRRLKLAQAEPDAAQRCADRLPLERLPPAKVAAGYHPQGGELDPGPVLARLAGAGLAIAYPAATSRDAPMAFRAWTPGDPLVPDAFGVPAPGPEAAGLFPRIVVCPLLAFDRAGGRLGQGAGAYDRAVANLRAAGPVFLLGLAYSGQEVAQLPRETHDEPLNAILTETEWIEVR